MDRGFFPGGGWWGRPFFRPFPHPFYPNRFLYPFFFFSPFFFPFFRDGQSDDVIFAQHTCQSGDSLMAIGHKYNIPHTILEEANQHLQNPGQLSPGETVYIPRISNMLCQKTFSEVPVQHQQQNPHQQQHQ